MNDLLDYDIDEEDVALANAIDLAEDLERFFEKGGPGASLLAALRDDMVQAYLILPDVTGEDLARVKIRIEAYRLLINKVKQNADFLVEARHDVAASDRRFIQRVNTRDFNSEEDS